jgi:hypothetical protein
VAGAFCKHARPGRGGRFRAVVKSGSIAVAALGCAVAAAGPAAATPAGVAAGPVSTRPAAGTPQLAPTGSTEQVRQLVQCGGTMYAVGRFTAIQQGSTVYSRNNIFSFSATAPFTMTAWNPNANGRVNSIAFNGTNCANAYIGGDFTAVHGTAASHIAEISTSTGAVVPGFAHSANGRVDTLAVSGGHVLAGGYFTSVNGSGKRFMVSLNAVTGKDDGFINLNISGNYQYPDVSGNGTRVYNQQISHGGTLDLVEGDFTSVGGLPRQQIFMLNLAASPARVTGWTSSEFTQHCWKTEPFYVRAASWSPSDSVVYIGTTGYKLATGGKGLCDVAAAFPATQAPVSHLWVNYTGCDSLYSTAADTGAAYFGGHERWADNPGGCDSPGPGAISAPGMVGLSPATGAVVWNPTRGRGLGADDMLITGAGLWIASDNFKGTAQCGGVQGHAGICFMPYG